MANFKSTPSNWLIALCAIFSFAITPLCVAKSADSVDLTPYQWKNRVLLITAPNQEDTKYRIQAAALMSGYPGLLERDLIVLTTFGATAFTVTLIGKDGGVKLKRDQILSGAELFAIIDAMPMRRAEMRD